MTRANAVAPYSRRSTSWLRLLCFRRECAEHYASWSTILAKWSSFSVRPHLHHEKKVFFGNVNKTFFQTKTKTFFKTWMDHQMFQRIMRRAVIPG